MATTPAVTYMTKSSVPPEEKISIGRSETIYTGITTRVRKKASRYRAKTGNGTR